MAKSKEDCAKYTGASAGSILVGIEPCNRDLRVRIYEDIRKGYGGRIRKFTLLHEGTNDYSDHLKEFVGQDFERASELINRLNQKMGTKCRHILNANTLKVLVSPNDPSPATQEDQGPDSLQGNEDNSLINGGEGLPDSTEQRLSLPVSHTAEVGAGFGDPEKNKEVENTAVMIVTNLYKKEGWTVESVEYKKCGYDLICKKGDRELHVEVKGISGSEPSFIITPNEKKAAEEDPLFRIAIVTNVMSTKPQVYQLSGEEFLKKYELIALHYRAIPISEL